DAALDARSANDDGHDRHEHDRLAEDRRSRVDHEALQHTGDPGTCSGEDEAAEDVASAPDSARPCSIRIASYGEEVATGYGARQPEVKYQQRHHEEQAPSREDLSERSVQHKS